VTNKLQSSKRQQGATYWGAKTPDGYGGGTWPTPVFLDPDTDTGVRWEEKGELFLDKTGAQVLSNAVVYPGTDLALGGYLGEGDQTASSDPTVNGVTAYEIRRIEKIPDRKAAKFLRRVFL